MSKEKLDPQDIIERVKSTGSKKVKLAITDIDGVLRGKYIHTDKFLSAIDGGFGFCNVVFGWDCADVCYDNVTYTGWHTGYPDAEARIGRRERNLDALPHGERTRGGGREGEEHARACWARAAAVDARLVAVLAAVVARGARVIARAAAVDAVLVAVFGSAEAVARLARAAAVDAGLVAVLVAVVQELVVLVFVVLVFPERVKHLLLARFTSKKHLQQWEFLQLQLGVLAPPLPGHVLAAVRVARVPLRLGAPPLRRRSCSAW